MRVDVVLRLDQGVCMGSNRFHTPNAKRQNQQEASGETAKSHDPTK